MVKLHPFRYQPLLQVLQYDWIIYMITLEPLKQGKYQCSWRNNSV